MKAEATDRRRGAALVVVLMFSALIAGLAGATVRDGLSAVRAARVFADVVQADELGRAAADIVAYQLLTGPDDMRRGGSIAVQLKGAEVSIDYVSESARIDINTAPVGLISALLSAAGADQGEVTAIAGRITAFRGRPAPGRPGPGAAAPGAAPAAPSSLVAALPQANTPGPPARSIQVAAEVTQAWGLPDGLAQRVLPSLTTANGTPQVDPVLADRLVLAALFDGSDTRVDDYVERREQGFASPDSALALLPVPSQALVGFRDVGAVRAIARVTVARRFERRYEMIVVPSELNGRMPVVSSWRKLP